MEFRYLLSLVIVIIELLLVVLEQRRMAVEMFLKQNGRIHT